MLQDIQRRGNELAQLIPEIRQAEIGCMDQENHERRRMRKSTGMWLGGRAAALLDGAGGAVRLQLNLSECRLVLRDILRQDVQQRLGLLRAQINALKVVDE